MPAALRCALGALLLAAAPARAALPDAPLGVATPGPFRALFLDMPLADARAPAAIALDVRWWLANDWSKPTVLVRGGRTVSIQDDLQVDTLQVSLTVPWRRLVDAAFARRLSTTLEARAFVEWGGWTDRPIESWHGLVGSWNFERQLYPRDQVNLHLSEEGGHTIGDVHSDRLALADLVLRTQLELASTGADPAQPALPPRGALALRLDVKLPTGARGRFAGSGTADAGLGLAASGRTGRLTVHALASVRVVGGLPGSFALQPRRVQGGFDLSLVLRVGGGVALVLEDRLSSPLMEAGWKLAPDETEPEATVWYSLFRVHNQVSGGIRVGELTAFFSEDFTPGQRLPDDPGPRWFYDSNAPDVVFGLAWARGF
ncbi:DUF3187 family protein [Anaeromyxobacter oryzae]|uniref:DUF3187 family protein n=1 Tax=Anaeromyxobacter oryzae TaxID=2918170 RepID=A0ABM7WUN9_9BACT|nr:DUF3187 family protein [Anaeromyxobacter oryzae]BDG03195.1 hypothetical protein AMOR_21910 [Anaeromyxobacter oryzae]